MKSYHDHPLTGATDIDSAFNKLWSFYKKYFAGLWLISVAASLLSSLLLSGIDTTSMQGITDPQELIAFLKPYRVPYLLALLVTLLLSLLLHAWILLRPGSSEGYLGELLKVSLTTLIPYMAVMIIVIVSATMLISIGLVLLILPGLFALFYMITVGLFVMPVMLTETTSPLKAFARAFRLTHTRLWPNVGWVTVMILMLVVVAIMISAITMVPFTGSLIRSLGNHEEAATAVELARNPLYIGVSSLTGALVTPVLPILAFILYFRSRGTGEAVTVTESTESQRVRVEDLYPKMPDNQ